MSIAVRALIGFGIPLLLVLAAILLVPATMGQFLGISVRSWCLFACAPITSLLLALCRGRCR